MGTVGKSLAIILILTVSLSAVGLLMIKPAIAQSALTPTAPQFTVSYDDLSYDVAPTTTTDPFTGQQTTSDNGYHVDNKTLVFTILNQRFTPYNDSSGNEINMYYNFRVKGHYGDQWNYYPYGLNGASTWLYGRFDMGALPSFEFPASNSAYTTVYISLYSFFDETTVSTGSQLDVQAQALVGQVNIVYTGLIAGDGYNFTGESSGWSNTQMITVADGTTTTSIPDSPSQNTTASQTPAPSLTTSSTPTPAIPEFPTLTIFALFLSVSLIAFRFRRRNVPVLN